MFVLFLNLMQNSAKAPFTNRDDLRSKMQGLIYGRMAFIFLLLLASWWWTNGYLAQSIQAFPQGLFLFFMCSALLTAVYQLLMHFSANLISQIRAQFLLDVLLITWLVMETGSAGSPYIALYIILISVTGIFLRKKDTLFIAAACAASFTVIAVLSAHIFNSQDSDLMPVSRIVQLVGVNVIAILIVGLLAARLSERTKVNDELKESTESFADLNVLHERIVQSIGSGLITTDLEKKVYAFNRAAEEISGLGSSDVIGHDVFSFFSPEIEAPVARCLAAVKGNEILTEHFEASIIPVNGNGGQPRQVSCSVSPLVSRSGATTGLILTFQDLTQIRLLEQTLRRTDRIAAVGRMAAGLAHEIRNPLGSMSSALQFLQEKVPPSTDESALMQVILRESDRLNSIITNFLAYARPPSDGFARKTQAVMDVGVAIDDCVVLLRHSPEAGDDHIIQFEMPKMPVKIQADETQIKQVFWNLLQNSLQAMPNGGKLTVELDDSPANFVNIVFSDTGSGMSVETRENLFEPFAEGARGTGLGLSIVHRIITGNGGRIDVQSEAGEGTSITLELPKRAISDRQSAVSG